MDSIAALTLAPIRRWAWCDQIVPAMLVGIWMALGTASRRMFSAARGSSGSAGYPGVLARDKRTQHLVCSRPHCGNGSHVTLLRAAMAVVHQLASGR